jgi:glycosyltransferase involved in cell wall biosynthesis
VETVHKKVVYILPSYEEGTDTHFYYNYELIKKVRDQLDLFVIVEKCQTCPTSNVGQLGVPYYVQKFGFAPLRFLELLFVCFKLHVSGFKNFYVHYSYYGALTGWLAGGTVFYWNRGMPWLFKRGLFEENVIRFIFGHSILVTSPESLAQVYKKHYRVKEYRILSNWVDVERFRPTKEKEEAKKEMGIGLDKKVILFVHHLSRRKGVDLIIPIAEKFKESGTLFLVAGSGPEEKNLRIKIQNLGLDQTITLLGKVPNTEIVKYFWASDIFLMPSREEGSPHVLLEAMASGVPFVASNVGGVSDLVSPGHEWYLCASEDVKCFASKINSLLSDEKNYADVRQEILLWAHRFDIDRGVQEFIKLFDF